MIDNINSMTKEQMEKLKYPIGRYVVPKKIDFGQMADWALEIEQLPLKLRLATQDLTEEQLDTQYRPDGWTLRQVVHHMADSHINAYTRFKLGMTEDTPTIKPYDEKLWAEEPEAKSGPIEVSLRILDGVHQRWATAIRGMNSADRKRELVHPDNESNYVLDKMIGMYAWHSNHHLAHILETRKAKGF